MSSQTAAGGESARQSTTPLSIRDIHNVNTTAAPGVALSDHERLLVGSILDLYEGRGTLRHLSLWSQHAYHANPPGIMTGHRRIVAAWYAHAASLESSHIQSHMVQSTSPIRFNLSINETFRGLGLQVMINSEVRVHVDEDGKIKRLEERWDTVTNEGARRAQSIQGQSFLGQAWIRISEWCFSAACTSVYWWAAWPLRRAIGFLATECTWAFNNMQDWEFEVKGEHRKSD